MKKFFLCLVLMILTTSSYGNPWHKAYHGCRLGVLGSAGFFREYKFPNEESILFSSYYCKYDLLRWKITWNDNKKSIGPKNVFRFHTTLRKGHKTGLGVYGGVGVVIPLDMEGESVSDILYPSFGIDWRIGRGLAIEWDKDLFWSIRWSLTEFMEEPLHQDK